MARAFYPEEAQQAFIGEMVQERPDLIPCRAGDMVFFVACTDEYAAQVLNREDFAAPELFGQRFGSEVFMCAYPRSQPLWAGGTVHPQCFKLREE